MVVSGTCNECDVNSRFTITIQPDPQDLAEMIRYGEISIEDMSEGSSACVGEIECLTAKILLNRRYAGYTQESYTQTFGFQKQTMISDGNRMLWIVSVAETQQRASQLHDYLFAQTEAYFGTAN